jgi:hypothetical protein
VGHVALSAVRHGAEMTILYAAEILYVTTANPRTREFTPELGVELAKHLINAKLLNSGLQIDVRELKPELLISAFFVSFLRHVQVHAPHELEEARRIDWITKYEFQRQAIKIWMRSNVSSSFLPPSHENEPIHARIMAGFEQETRGLSPDEDMAEAAFWRYKMLMDPTQRAGRVAAGYMEDAYEDRDAFKIAWRCFRSR